MDHAKVEYTYIAELNHLLYMIDNRMWMMYVNTPQLEHMVSADTRANASTVKQMSTSLDRSYDKWMELHGIHGECTLCRWYSIILVNHMDEIVNAFNNYDFDSIDYIFDEFYPGWGDCSICQIAEQCAYVNNNKSGVQS